jgi:hypothetical protein
MKHIFSVHSPITFLVAYATIKHLELKKENVFFLSATYKVLLDDYKVILSFSEARNKSFLQKIKYFNVPKSHDQYLDIYLKGQEFTAYIDMMSYAQKALVTHNQCKEFHFIEEGNSTYQTNDDLQDISWPERKNSWRGKGVLDFKSWVRVLRGYNLRLLSLPYIYSAYANMVDIKFFAFSENAYYNVSSSKRILVKPPKEDPNINKLAGGHFLNNATIWLDGSNGKFTGLDESYYYKAIEKAIPILKQKRIIKDKVYAKLRPGIKDFSTNKLVSILKANNIEVEVMPNDMIIEAFFIESNNCKVIGVLTSVLEYAHVFGHKAYSIYGLFEKQPPTFFDRMNGFWDNIENLKE